MKKRMLVDAMCLGCKRTDREYHAKGLCKACYVMQLRKKGKKSVAAPLVDK